MGCLRSLGCLVLLVLIAAAGWIFRADWMPLLRRGAPRPAPTAAAPTAEKWDSLTPEGAARAREAVKKLGERSGPVFSNLSPGELAAYVHAELARQLPPSAQHIEAAAIGDQLWLRADVKLSELGGTAALGPLAGMLGDREPVRLGGTLEIVRPGLAEFRVQSLRVRDISIPKPMIPKLISALDRGKRPSGISPDALPLTVPAYIADVRVRSGKVTLYKAIP